MHIWQILSAQLLIPGNILGSLTVTVSALISCRCVILPNYWECTLAFISDGGFCRCVVLSYEGSTNNYFFLVNTFRTFVYTTTIPWNINWLWKGVIHVTIQDIRQATSVIYSIVSVCLRDCSLYVSRFVFLHTIPNLCLGTSIVFCLLLLITSFFPPPSSTFIWLGAITYTTNPLLKLTPVSSPLDIPEFKLGMTSP